MHAGYRIDTFSPRLGGITTCHIGSDNKHPLRATNQRGNEPMKTKVLLAAIAALMATNSIAMARTAKPEQRPAASAEQFDIQNIHEQLRLSGS